MATEKEKYEIFQGKLKISFSYTNDLILPLEEGLAFLSKLKYAESIDKSDYKNPKIIPFKEDIAAVLVSDFEYNEMKVAKIFTSDDNNDK